MKFGIVTPAATLSPRSRSSWEQDAGPAEIRSVVEAADRFGFDYLTCSEHVAIPEAAVGERGARYYDPAATLGYAAAITRRIRLATHVLVLPYHHPLEVVKRFGTVDRLSAGRLILGVGVGSLEPEFDLLGVEFAKRGAAFEDALRALRACFGEPTPKYRGTHYTIAGFRVDPTSPQKPPPIWLGGRSARSLRRAIALGDGWNPFRLDAAQLEHLLSRARQTEAWDRRAASEVPFDVVLTPERPFDLDGDGGEERAQATIEKFRQIGATAMNVRLRHRSAAHCVELLDRFSALFALSRG